MIRASMKAFLFSLVVSLSVPVQAITGNWVPDTEHPFVGLVVFYDENGDFLHRCSGSLLTPTVLLTAGHCTDGATTARVYFQQDAGANYNPTTELDPVTGYPEFCAPGTLGVTCATSEQLYNFGFDDFAGYPNTSDAGLVILDQPIAVSEYGKLAPPGTLDGLDRARGTRGTIFTVSGYGLTYSVNSNSPLSNISFRSRLMAQSTLVNLNSGNNAGFNLQTQGNGNSRGGTCGGDSGGPVFLGGPNSNLIVGVTSFGLNDLCRGTDFAYRTDTEAVLAWIEDITGVVP